MCDHFLPCIIVDAGFRVVVGGAGFGNTAVAARFVRVDNVAALRAIRLALPGRSLRPAAKSTTLSPPSSRRPYAARIMPISAEEMAIGEARAGSHWCFLHTMDSKRSRGVVSSRWCSIRQGNHCRAPPMSPRRQRLRVAVYAVITREVTAS